MSDETDKAISQNGDVPVSTSDAGSTPVDDEPAVSIDELLQEEEERVLTARAVLGGQDQIVCTWPEGYLARQPIFACLTCTSNNDPAGICFGCSLNCHDGHNIVELYTKRKFRCDCGNKKFSVPCQLYEDKSDTNSENIYNHNYFGLFCHCNRHYPDPELQHEVMTQCVMCEDWFHSEHVSLAAEQSVVLNADEVVTSMEDFSFVCESCSGKYLFMEKLVTGVGKLCLKNVNYSDIVVTGHALSLSTGWRLRLCNCSHCAAEMEKLGCDFLLNKDDDIEEYERQNLKKTECEQEPDIIESMTKTLGRDAAIGVLQGMHNFAMEFGNFIRNKNDNLVTKADVDEFVQQIKRRRLNDNDA